MNPSAQALHVFILLSAMGAFASAERLHLIRHSTNHAVESHGRTFDAASLARRHARAHVLANDLRVIMLDLPDALWAYYYRLQLDTKNITLITHLPPTLDGQRYAAAYNTISFAAIDRQFGDRFIETLLEDSQPTKYIVYVIDASGSMLPDLELTVHNVLNATTRLSPRTTVAIIFYQNGKAIPLLPRGYSRPNKEWRETVRAMMAEREIIPRGSSNPYAALEKAFWLEPTEINWISNGLGLGRYEEDRRLLVNRIRRSRESYKSPVNAFKLNTNDDQTTMQNIVKITGGNYRFIDDPTRDFSD